MAGRSARSAASCATASGPRACRTCSTCPSRASRARACSPPCGRTSRYPPVRPARSAHAEPSYVLRALGRDDRLGREQPALQSRAASRARPTSIRRATVVTRRPCERLRQDRRAREIQRAHPPLFRACRPRRDAGRPRTATAARRAAARRAPGCNSTCRWPDAAGGPARARRCVSSPSAARTSSPPRRWWPSRRWGGAPEPGLPESVQALRERFEVPVEKLGRLFDGRGRLDRCAAGRRAQAAPGGGLTGRGSHCSDRRRIYAAHDEVSC